VGVVTATAVDDTLRNLLVQTRTYGALVRSGFRRYATYRQATVAGAVTNSVFGFLRCYSRRRLRRAGYGSQRPDRVLDVDKVRPVPAR
jgi:hypothetical protein